RYSADHVMIGNIRHKTGLVVMPSGIESGWATAGFDALEEADFARLAALGAEIVLIGTGSRQRFPAPALLRPLIEARIGFEVMEMGAACRTYNILVGEGRNVALALLFDVA
ncbi:MAG: Xcc1710-like domain-containing protein, partial [Zoogloea sp.]|nr:Xcc1710-like domain-containing protein [Zoogloea sp.]